jgi:hypothetical protein
LIPIKFIIKFFRVPRARFIEWLENETELEERCLAIPAGIMLVVVFFWVITMHFPPHEILEGQQSEELI